MKATLKVLICMALLTAIVFAQSTKAGWPLDLGDLGPDLTEGIIPDTSSSYGSESGGDKYYPAALTDNTFDPTGEAEGGNVWASHESGLDEWFTIAFPTERPVATVVIYWAVNHFQKDYTASQEIHIQTSSDGIAFTDSQILYPTQAGPLNFSDSVSAAAFDPIACLAIRVYQPGGMGNAKYASVFWVCEVEMFSSKATVGVNRQVTTVWQPLAGLTAQNTARGVRFSMAKTDDYRLTIYDLAGRSLWGFAGNEQSIIWNPGNTGKGVYLAVLKQDNGIARRAVVLK